MTVAHNLWNIGKAGIAAASFYKKNHAKPKSKPKGKGKTRYELKFEHKAMTHDNLPAGQQESYMKFHTGLKKPKGVVSKHLTYRDETNYTLTWLGNQQYAGLMNFIGTTSQFMTGTSNSTAANRDSVSYAPWFSLNPEQGLAAGNILTANSNPSQDAMAVISSTSYLDILNASSIQCFVKVHVYMARTDTSSDPLYYYSQGAATGALYNSNFQGPASGAAFTTGVSGNEVVTYSASTTSGIATLSSVPYTKVIGRRLPRSVWKRLSTTTLMLAGGDSHRMTINGKHNQFAIKERLNTISATYPKGSTVVMFEAQGAACLDTTAVSGSYSLAAGKIGVVVTRKVHLAPMAIPNKRFETLYVGAGNVANLGPLGNDKVIGTSITSVSANILV